MHNIMRSLSLSHFMTNAKIVKSFSVSENMEIVFPNNARSIVHFLETPYNAVTRMALGMSIFAGFGMDSGSPLGTHRSIF